MQIVFKRPFLETAHHYGDLNAHSRQQLAAFLTYVALNVSDGYTASEFQTAIGALPQEGLKKTAHILWQALEASGEQREDYWRNRILPFWQKIWPKSGDRASKSIAGLLAQMAIAARGEFPSALDTVYSWLEPNGFPQYPVHLLDKSGLCARFPKDALRLLDAIIGDSQWVSSELGACLEAIKQKDLRLVQDPRYHRLQEYLRKQTL